MTHTTTQPRRQTRAATARRTVTLTGVQPTGDLHLGNYVGAVRPLTEIAADPARDVYVFVADLHALNGRPDPAALRERSRRLAAALLACGLDRRNVYLYRQSRVPAVARTAALLSGVAAKGLLNRAHAYKAAVGANVAAGREPDHGVNMGLYSYPVLMAADILALDADEVPVGADQAQHLEIAIDLAQQFARSYQPGVLREPRALIAEATATLLVEHEVRIAAPRREEAVLEAGARHPLEVDRRDDLVGVDVAALERNSDAGVGGELLHGSGLLQVGGRGQRAADSGGRRDRHGHQVRAPALALPALEVAVGRRRAALLRSELVGVHAEAHRAAGTAPLRTRVDEDLVEALLDRLVAHAHRARHDEQAGAVGGLWPLMISAARRRSSMRPLVQEPTNTVSTLISRIGVPASRPMYSSAFSVATLSSASSKSSGLGTVAPSGTPWPGLVPQVTNGVISEASSTISLSNSASSSVTSVLQCSTAASQSAPFGASGLPSM